MNGLLALAGAMIAVWVMDKLDIDAECLGFLFAAVVIVVLGIRLLTGDMQWTQ